MREFHICTAAPGPDWVYAGYHELDAAISVEMYDEDNSTPTDQVQAWHADQVHGRKALLLALPGPAPADALIGRYGLPVVPAEPVKVLGITEIYLPTTDNLHLLDNVSIMVRADQRRAGIGAALAREVRRIAVDEGRDTIVGWSQHSPGAPARADDLVGPDGGGHVPLDHVSRFALAAGYSLAQVERQSRLLLPLAPELLAQLLAEAEAKASPEYRAISWAGPTPAELRDGVARMHAALSTDAPLGDVDWQPEIWDAARVQQMEERVHRTSRLLTTVAVEVASGDVVALTDLHLPNAHPQRLEQGTTTVDRAHRGHRLGLLVKVANLQLLAQTQPDAVHVDTWNAGENEWMLAINTALGYRRYTNFGIWQAKLG
ncbi:MAG TPA: hypothetical protein PLL50_05575 [Propionicimonas sp.]|nr:hypothetical protein [Propionicimonas sp.]HQA77808.1 hypothetical protein [Propionicimonas sp.]HQD96691.1 hypothetical protein [Propionicimonas sp.]